MFAINILVKLLDDKIQLRYSEREQNNTVEYNLVITIINPA